MIMTCPKVSALLWPLLLLAFCTFAVAVDSATTDHNTLPPTWEQEFRSIAHNELEKSERNLLLVIAAVGVSLSFVMGLSLFLLYKLVLLKHTRSKRPKTKNTQNRNSSKKRQTRSEKQKKKAAPKAKPKVPIKGAVKGPPQQASAKSMGDSPTVSSKAITINDRSQLQSVSGRDQPTVLHMTDESNNQQMVHTAAQDTDQLDTSRSCYVLENDSDIELVGQGNDQRRVIVDHWNLSDSGDDRHVCTSDDVITDMEY